MPAASRSRLAELSLSADVFDVRGPRPGLSGRPVRIIDPFGAGGGVDVIARALARRLAAAWGQRVIVENHPGAGSTAAPALVANAPPDGYTLLINTSAQAYSAARAGELPYDPCGTSEFGAFVVSEAERAAVLLSTS
jgi:tripartite-type tricarboxylate transporter receptor subunit TctC